MVGRLVDVSNKVLADLSGWSMRRSHHIDLTTHHTHILGSAAALSQASIFNGLAFRQLHKYVFNHLRIYMASWCRG